jgi:hypothetical protein
MVMAARSRSGRDQEDLVTRRAPFIIPLLLVGACTPAAPWPPAVCGSAACADGQVCTLNKACVAPRYTDNGDGTVTDDQTGLVWQKSGSSSSFTWNDGEAPGSAQAFCTNLVLGGYKGWRLPRLPELNSLTDLGTDPSIDATAFPDTPGGWYWTESATDYEFLAFTQAWIVNSSGGGNITDTFDHVHFVRCVHGNSGTDCTCSASDSCTDSCGNQNAAATSCHARQCSQIGSGLDTCGLPDPACPDTCVCVDPSFCGDSCGRTGRAATACLGLMCDALGDGNDTCGAPDPSCPGGSTDGGT